METPSWNSLKDIWPHADASRFIEAAGLRWHVQVLGKGDTIVLLHGAGAASHSWRDVAPILAREFTVVVPDLPGHGLTSRPRDERFTLNAMAEDLATLLRTLHVRPSAIAGHSAGGALALRMALDERDDTTLRSVIGVNAALSTPAGIASSLLAPVRAIVRTPAFGTLTAWLAGSDKAFDTLLSSTGSRVSAAQHELYRIFARSPEHTSALMNMFSSWDVNPMLAELSELTVPVTLIAASGDEWIPPAQSVRVERMMSDARVIMIEGAGHLAHEEEPARVASIIAESIRDSTTAGSRKRTT